LTYILDKLKSLAPTQIISLGYAATILLGAILLSLPISSSAGCFTSFTDSLFTATSAVCITGLTVLETAGYWSPLGKLIIIMLIQIGGIGFMSIVTMIFVFVGKKITLKERVVIQESLNINQKHGLVSFTIYIFKLSIVVELIGAVILTLRFLSDYEPAKAVAMGLFHSISAYCNAGFDIIGSDSLMPYAGDFVINITIMLLIITGGLGFPVMSDIFNLVRDVVVKKHRLSHCIKRLRLHTKIAVLITVVLIVAGALFFFIVEFTNPATIGGFSLPDKIIASLFQSVTLRTAGYASIPQGGLTYASKVVGILLMFIGGSPAGTAGGVKTVTVGVIMLAVLSIINGRTEINVFRRNIPIATLQKALSIVVLLMGLLLTASITLTFTEARTGYTYEFLDLLYEVASAVGTVGLTTGITPHLSTAGKLVIIICMYIGRLGPVSVAIALTSKKKANKSSIHYPEDNLIVG
jgi:trk system potassium uptake protein TrkH